MTRRTTASLATALAGLAGAVAFAADGARSPASYIATWAPTYRAFGKVYVSAYRPCLKGATKECGEAQQLAAAAARRAAAMLSSASAPKALARDIAQLQRDLRAGQRTLATSATAARAGDTSQRRWCSAEQGPCTVVMIDMGNVIGDINFVAKVDLPLPA